MKRRQLFLVMVVLMSAYGMSNAQLKELRPHTMSLSGNLRNDLMHLNEDMLQGSITDDPIPSLEEKKYSSLYAALFSATIPGAGQFYTKSYWQGAMFLGAEALLWILYSSNEN
jgi:hypothetical protein